MFTSESKPKEPELVYWKGKQRILYITIQMREAEALDLEIKLQLAKVGFRIEGRFYDITGSAKIGR